MAIEVFNRHENKYMLDDKTCRALQNRLSDYMEQDAYNRGGVFYTITNLYYDTEDDFLIRTSLSKPKYKEKLRLRAYGVPKTESKVYLEIKKKFDGIVNKRRSEMKLSEAEEFLQSGLIPSLEPYMNRQVLKEIKYILTQYGLKPKLYLAYDRMAYFGIEQKDLRISFDCNLRTRRTDLKLESGDYGEELLEEGKWLMEIKAKDTMPEWLLAFLSEHHIYPTSFSKYGAEYIKFLRSRITSKTMIMVPSPEQVSRGKNGVLIPV